MAALLVTRAANCTKSHVAPAVSFAIVCKRDCHHQVAPGQPGTYHHSLAPRGRGGRSSFSGVVATVFGATGFVGRYVVNRLGREGSQIVVPYRCDPDDTRHLKVMGDLGQIVMLEVDVKSADSVRDMMQHSNVVINLMGKDFETRNFHFNDTNIEVAGRIARIARELKIPRLIHMSALGADMNSRSKFLRTKAAGEDVVKKEFPGVTILRPAQIYGREDRYFNHYANHRFFGGVPLFFSDRKALKQPVYVTDIAQAVMNVIKDRETIGKTYELAGPHRYQLEDLVHYIYRVTSRSYICYPVPRPLLHAIARIFEISYFNPWMSRDKLERYHTTEKVAPGMPGLEDLGIKPVSVEEAAIHGLRRHRADRYFEDSVEQAEPAKHV
ncbi:NADH dehydrogenase [ubiquinone] 1 alpha subcomplex subunit 9, mitochondrial-like [Glandiceps talaboti]